MSDFIYIVGYDIEAYPHPEASDFLGAWTDREDMLNFLRNDPRATYVFIDQCWVAELGNGNPNHFVSLHADPEIGAIMESKRGEDQH